MDRLPDEMLDIVFQYLSMPVQLSVCVRVCRRWQLVVERRALALRDDGDERRLHRATHCVLLTTFPVDMYKLMDDITMKARHLRELTAHAPAPFYEPHVAALSLLPQLTHLDVFTQPRVLDEQFADVARRLRSLVANESLAPGLLRELAAGSQLSALHMFGRALHYPRRELLAVLRARAPHLRALTLRCTELPDAAYEVIGDCLNLRELRLYSCWLLTAAGARAVCRPRRVRRLHVTGARLVRRAALADMLELLPDSLDELVLSSGWFGDEHVRALERHAAGLRVLELWRCKLTAAGALALAAALPLLQHLDLDLTLSACQLQELARHPRLRWVRCLPEHARCGPGECVQRQVCGLHVTATHAQYSRKYFRTGGEGFRGALYYYWTQDMPLEPLPPFTYPGVDPYEDLFY